MTSILRTTLATALAAACLAGASVTFAADNNNNNGKNNPGSGINSTPGRNNNDSDVLPDPMGTGSVKCDNNQANQQSGCDQHDMDQQPQ
jgi:hypothetical protein